MKAQKTNDQKIYFSKFLNYSQMINIIILIFGYKIFNVKFYKNVS